MKRLIAVLLVGVLMLGVLAACTPTPVGPTDGTNSNGGNVGGNNIYAGDPNKDYRDQKVYTYLDYIGGTTGLNWNPHQWETNDDSYVLGYLSTGLYDFVLNANKNGYQIVCEAAAALPVDVTSEYVGKYGIVAGESAKAWKIALNPALTWEDGTKINAETYVWSMQQLLDPLALNRRADSFYSGDFEIVNAKAYFYDGKTSYKTVGNQLASYIAKGETIYVDMDFWGCTGALDKNGNPAPRYIAYTDETLYRDLAVTDEKNPEAWVSAKYIYETYLKEGAAYASYGASYLNVAQTLPKVSFDEVGIKALDEYTLLIVVAAPVADPDFYMPYNLSSSWIVKKDVYESCQKWYDKDGKEVAKGSKDAVSVTNTYHTKLENSTSFGPYKLSYYELDKQITFERNDKWYGYSDGKHYGQYQTDKISCEVLKEHKTIFQKFLAGELDGVGLDSTDMATYSSSDRIRYTPESYTTKISFNTDKAALEKIGGNAVILTIAEFREAFSLAIDREKFCSENTASHEAGYGMLNYLYCYDPFNGLKYRDSEYAKKALVDLYGLEYGEGKKYADLDEAYDAITGYDPTTATELMKVAAKKAVDEKLWDGTSQIVLDFRMYAADDAYVKMFNFFDAALKAVCKGTAFEGKISLKMTVDEDYYETMYSGNATIIFTTWGGAAKLPFTLMYQCYCDGADGSGNQMEYGFDTTKVMVTQTVNGKEVTASLQDWAHWCNGDAIVTIDNVLGKFASYSYDDRCKVFAQLEYTYLDSFVTAPIYYRNSASLISRKIEQACNEYVDELVGYGGLRFITYNYDDAAWATAKGSVKYN